MSDITATLTASDEQLLTAAGADSIDFEAMAAPSIVLGEPCDV
jgi:hypothetical protein